MNRTVLFQKDLSKLYNLLGCMSFCRHTHFHAILILLYSHFLSRLQRNNIISTGELTPITNLTL
jgi:hypothetical protein